MKSNLLSNNTVLIAVATLIVTGLFVSPAKSQVENWPQWRGAKLDNKSNETDLPDSISKDDAEWRFELPGQGGASPIVWGDKIFLTSADKEDQLWIMCVSTAGKKLWAKQLDGKNRRQRMDGANSASPSPATDGKHVWAMSTNGIMHCYTVDGELVWKKDMQEEYGKFDIQFGMASTAILDKGHLYFQFIHGNMRDRSSTSVGWVIALKADDGSEVFKFKRETNGVAENKHSYTSPTIYRDEDQEFLITHGADFVIGHSLKDGSEIWRCGGFHSATKYNPFLRFVSSPVCAEGMIVVPSAKNGPVLALKPNLKGDVTGEEEFQHWKLPKGTPDVSTPLIHDGLVYITRENGVVSVTDAKTGERTFQKRMLADKHRSSAVAADGKLYITGRRGTVTVLEMGAEPEVLSTTDLGEETTASVAISGGRVFVRTYDALYSFRKQE